MKIFQIVNWKNYLMIPTIARDRDGIFNANLENFLILNFNYTKTASGIKASIESKGHSAEIVHIHGKLSQGPDKIVLGYGDETDLHCEGFR